jgi:4-hydroxybenzoate polyprenyltransferase
MDESILDLFRRSPRSVLSLPSWLLKGKAYFKHKLASQSQLDAGLLPLRSDLVEWLKEQRKNGHPIILVTASNRQIADRVAGEVGIFADVIGSTPSENLKGEAKRKALVARFGERGFDYVGNATADLAVWRSARHAIVVGGDRLCARAAKVTEVKKTYAPTPTSALTWLKAARLHQWVKNILVFVPALVAHRFTDPIVLARSLQAFVAFSLCASSVYIINDLLDLDADRRHPRKRRRPFAAGTLSVRSGVLAAMVLISISALVAWYTGPRFSLVLASYYILTFAYTFSLKRAALVDVLALAALYTLRIVAGAAATMIRPSFWLLAFSIFVFLCLGIVKRYAELHDAVREGRVGGHGRGYSGADLHLLMSMGLASGFCAVIVMALYINSPDSQVLYRHIEPMWLICPLLLYWLSRMWLLASRGQMDDDPVVFAVKDRISLATMALIGLLVFAAI